MSSVDREFIEKKTRSYIYNQLRDEPHYGMNIKKLVGYDPATWRYRIGKFRLFYAVDDAGHVVSVLAIEFRRDAY
jgi:mRNA interferase RelE/StbE